MTEDRRQKKSRVLESGVEELHLENNHTKREQGSLCTDEIKEESASINSHSSQDATMEVVQQSLLQAESPPPFPTYSIEKREEIIGGEVIVKQEPGQPPKLSRSTSHKIISRPPPLFYNCPDKTKEAQDTFQLTSECSYTSKHIGSTEHDSMDCDCAEEWGKAMASPTLHRIWE